MISFHPIKIVVIQRKQLIPLLWHQGTTFRQLPGTKSRLSHRVMNLCSNCWAQLTMDFLLQNKTSLRRSRNITNIGMTFTALMVLYCIRTALSYHHRYRRTYLITCTLPIRALAPCSQEQWKLFFGPVSPKLSMFVKIAVLTAIVIHLPNHITIIGSSGPRLPFSMYLWQFLPLSRCPNSCCHWSLFELAHNWDGIWRL